MPRPLAVLVALAALMAAPAASASGAGFVGFQSPTRNIGCVLDSSSARCDIARHAWRAPAKPASCDVDYGNGLSVSRTGSRGRFVCAGDTTLRSGKVLPYGRSLRRGGITCTSRTSGMTCKNARGHGFRLSRGSYRRF